MWVIPYLVLTFKCGVPDMTPNEWGDWSAGMAAPVAFLWLVLGYFQQGEELRANVEALTLQTEELKHTVAHQSAIAAQAERQANLTEQSQKLALRSQVASHQPCFVHFKTANANQGKNAFSIRIENVGRTCLNARFDVVSPIPGQKFKASPEVRNWTPGILPEIRLSIVAQPPLTIVFTIAYLDEVMTPQRQTFKLGLKRFPLNETVLGVQRIDATFNPPDVGAPDIVEEPNEELGTPDE